MKAETRDAAHLWDMREFARQSHRPVLIARGRLPGATD